MWDRDTGAYIFHENLLILSHKSHPLYPAYFNTILNNTILRQSNRLGAALIPTPKIDWYRYQDIKSYWHWTFIPILILEDTDTDTRSLLVLVELYLEVQCIKFLFSIFIYKLFLPYMSCIFSISCLISITTIFHQNQGHILNIEFGNKND